MSGSGVGFVYDNNQDILTIRDYAMVHVIADDKGHGEMDVATGGLEFRRPEKILNFSGGGGGPGGGGKIEAEAGGGPFTRGQGELHAPRPRGHLAEKTGGGGGGGRRGTTS